MELLMLGVSVFLLDPRPDWPAVEDHQRFLVSIEACQTARTMIGDYLVILEVSAFMRLGEESWSRSQRAVAELRWRWQVYDWLQAAKGGYGGDWQLTGTRRMSLARLRDLLGPEAYYAGRLPPPLPLEWFTPIE